MSEQPRSSDPSERPETLVERLKALSAKIRAREADFANTPVWACQSDAYEFGEWADELDAVLSSLASRAVSSTGEATYPKLNQAGRLAWEDGYAAGKRDAAPSDPPAPAASSGAAPQDRVALAVEALRDESLPHGAARFAALSILDPEPIRPADIEWAKRELAAAPPERPAPAAPQE